MRDPVNHNLAIVGGGLAGMAAALASRDFRRAPGGKPVRTRETIERLMAG